MKSILLPELGEGIKNVDIRDVPIRKGDTIKKDQTILVLETEKASMEIPSEYSGTIVEIYVKSGQKISPSDKILTIDEEENKDHSANSILENNNTNNDDDNSDESIKIKHEDNNNNLDVSEISSNSSSTVIEDTSTILASPGTKKLARELGCDIKLVHGTGDRGRISREDVLSYVNQHISSNNSGINKEELKMILKNEISLIKRDIINELSQNKEVNKEIDYSKWGSVETTPLNKIKKITGKNMSNAWASIPQVTQFDSADISDLYKIFKNLKNKNNNSNYKISLIPFYIKLLTKCIENFPYFNSSLNATKDSIIIKKYVNVGVAVDTKNGLVVPVIKNCEKKSLREITHELTALAKKAHDNKLEFKDIDGGTITISSLGGIGGTNFTPIVIPNQAAIIGFSKSEYKPIWIKNTFKKRLILPFSLTYDHRIIDGANAAKFTSKLKLLLSTVKLIGKK